MKHFLHTAIVLVMAQGLVTAQTGLTGKWKLVQFQSPKTGDVMNAEAGKNSVEFMFKDNGTTGKISGKSFCNTVNGHYTLEDSNKISVTNFGGSMSKCKMENELWGAIDIWSNYKLEKDKLTVYYNKGAMKMEFEKVEESKK